MGYKPAYRQILWRHFLNWGSFHSYDSSLCQVDIKLARTTNAGLTWLTYCNKLPPRLVDLDSNFSRLRVWSDLPEGLRSYSWNVTCGAVTWRLRCQGPASAWRRVLREGVSGSSEKKDKRKSDCGSKLCSAWSSFPGCCVPLSPWRSLCLYSKRPLCPCSSCLCVSPSVFHSVSLCMCVYIFICSPSSSFYPKFSG